jgi:hypothetical protein
MASPVSSSNAPATASSDWTVQAADTIESVVGSIRDKTAVPLETVARALVYGIILGVVGLATLLLLTVALVRAGTYLADVWIVDGALGAIFTLLGLLLWRKRRPRAAKN